MVDRIKPCKNYPGDNKKIFNMSVISSVSLLLLTGCPGIGDRISPREEAKVTVQEDNVCFWIPDAKGMEPTLIAINPRGTPYREQKIIFDPDLTVIDETLCIPQSFFHFPREGQLIVEYVLGSKNRRKTPRIVVTGIEMSGGHVRVIPLSIDERGYK